MVRRAPLGMLSLVVAAWACSPPAPAPKREPADARGKALADAYLEGWFERNPDQVTAYGVPGRHHDKFPDNSLESLRAWQAKEDAWLSQAKQIDPATIGSSPLRATYAIVREALEGSIAVRPCRTELWSVSQTSNGWQASVAYLAVIQPVGTEQARTETLARWGEVPRYIDTEIANLRQGLKAGYSAPKGNVRLVIDQITQLATGPAKDSPLYSPSERDRTPAFVASYTALVKDKITPALLRYRDFLQNEYLPAAREAVGVSANPNGAACYAGALRYSTTLPTTADEVHQQGLQQIDRITEEMQEIAERSFATADVPALLERLRTDPKFLFKSREELIAYSEAALGRAKAAAPQWFGLLPKADVRIEPYPKFREKSGPNEYNPPAEDGSRSGLFYISAYQAEKKSKAGAESTTFHETVPGHHLQMSLALERKDIHPIGRYLSTSGYVEGWALYAERLADEMGLYSSDLDRLGMLSNQAMRATRLVVDTGLHAQGWTRQQAIDYMLAHTTEAKDDAAAEIDRYIIWPGQATSYMLGMLEIRKARDEAEQQLGPKFDIKAFHDRVLEDGSVPLTYVRAKIQAWAAEGGSKKGG